MIIRKANAGDLANLTTLFDEYRMFYGKESDLPGATTFLRERITNNDSEIFVATLGQHALVGFVQLYPVFSSVRMKRLWLLNDLYINPHFRGQGLSVKLIDRAKQLARENGAAGLMLETARTNTIGNNLYARTGFTVDSEHNFYTWNTLQDHPADVNYLS